MSDDVTSGRQAPEQVTGHEELDDRSREILEFERAWWRHRGRKERMIRERFGLSAARYYQLLNRLIDSPAALRLDPMLVKRLRRRRADRRRQRFGSGLGAER